MEKGTVEISGVAEPRGSGGLQPPQLFGHANKFSKNEIFLGIQSQKLHYCGPWATQYTEYIKSYIAFFNVPTTLHNPHRVHMWCNISGFYGIITGQ